MEMTISNCELCKIPEIPIFHTGKNHGSFLTTTLFLLFSTVLSKNLLVSQGQHFARFQLFIFYDTEKVVSIKWRDFHLSVCQTALIGIRRTPIAPCTII